MPVFSPYEAGLTPEERENLFEEDVPFQVRPRLMGNDFMRRGAQTRMLSKNPIASLIASTLMGSSKYAAARARAFGDELQHLLHQGAK